VTNCRRRSTSASETTATSSPISSRIERPDPNLPDLARYQARGLMTDPVRRGEGLGSRLLSAGVERCAAAGTQVVWAAPGSPRRRSTSDTASIRSALPHRDVVLRTDRHAERTA
jgi:GNAT superfamily N-acetyltransferase